MQGLVTSYGKSREDAIDNTIQIVEQLPPLLSELEDGDIVVEVHAAEIVWTDTIMATGQYQHQAKTPYRSLSSPPPSSPHLLIISSPLLDASLQPWYDLFRHRCLEL